MVDRGAGFPVVMIPGIQGRWEWQEPALEALARHGRAITYSLRGEPGTGLRLTRADGFDGHVAQLDDVLARAGVGRVALCGVSYGGWVAVRYAARRPDRVAALVLVSAPGPGFSPDTRQQYYVRAPRLLLPLFVMSSRQRLKPEVLAALPDVRARRRFARGQLRRMARYPISPRLMARRVELALAEDFAADARRVQAPTLLLTGEPGLDRVVPVSSTHEYLGLIRGARAIELRRTGHIGLVTRPDEWADLVWRFITDALEHRGAAGDQQSDAVLAGAGAAGAQRPGDR